MAITGVVTDSEIEVKKEDRSWPTELIVDPQKIIEFRRTLGENFQEDRTLSRTLYWQMERENAFSTLYCNPPTAMTAAAERVLVVGTGVQIRNWSDLIGIKYRVVLGRPIEEANQDKYNGADRTLTVFDKLIRDLPDGSHQEIPIVYCRNSDRFWESFFASRQFLDDVAPTVPSLIVATGEMRNYAGGAGSTIEVSERLKEIAEHFNVPLVFAEVVDGKPRLSDERKAVAARAVKGLFGDD